jgi:glycosyltransferase involved in cell wall biosynthesis
LPYAELPRYLHGFDVCILPFKVIPLTLATNPVKVYEYLSAGKPVVAVDLPEMAQFGDLVTLAGDATAFLRGIAGCLDEPRDCGQAARRRAFAKNQTWTQRAATLMASVEREGPISSNTVSVLPPRGTPGDRQPENGGSNAARTKGYR